jgi:hypothetical protein
LSSPPPPPAAPRSRKRRLPPRLPRHLRGRVAVLGIVAALMVALPLSVLLRRQQTELDQLAVRRAVLDPMARSVDAQRSLLLHKGATGRVLRGQSGVEPERRVYQGEVDDRLTALAIALAVGPWERAVQENDALREGWSLLVRRYGDRRLSAEESDEGHGLLVEQTLQILDLLDMAQSGHPVDQAAASAPVAPPPRRAVPTQASLQAERNALDRKTAAIEMERRLVLLAMLVLGLTALRLARPVRAVAVDESGRPAPQTQAVEAGRLFDRLRRSDTTPSELPPDSRLPDARQP